MYIMQNTTDKRNDKTLCYPFVYTKKIFFHVYYEEHNW